MKKAFILGVTLLLVMTPSYADVYVKVDAQGNAIDGPIMCDSETCGADSSFSKQTLKEGERYVLQGFKQAGIGSNNPQTQVTVDIPTQTWTVTTPTQVSTFTPYQPEPSPIWVSPITDTSTVVNDTSTVLSDTSTAILPLESVNSFESIIAYFRLLLNQIYAIFEKLGIKG